MQATSSRFQQLQSGGVRPHSLKLAVSWDKQFDADVDFFILSGPGDNRSLLDSTDLLAPSGDNVITEWQKYDYRDYSDRVVSIEWIRESSLLTSTTAAMANVELNNYDDLFTRGAGGPIDSYLVPRRPLRIQAGFGSEVLPQFIGVSEVSPQADRGSRTSSLTAQDFLRYAFDRKLDRTVMVIDKRVDEILEDLFGIVGVLPSQMILDESVTTVSFAYFEKDQTLGNAVEQLMKAEMGSLYMDEQGFIVFKNRLRLPVDTGITFDETNIVDYSTSDESTIINSVSVKAEVRELQSNRLVFNLAEKIYIEAGDTVSKFFNFEDPVTSAEAITAYTANASEDGGGGDLTADLDITDQTLFGKSILVEMENTGSEPLYVTAMTIYGTPAIVVRNVDILEKNQDSIDQFEEQTYEVESPYIQDEDTAMSIALTLIGRFKDYASTLELTVKANPALQINDLVHVAVDNIDEDFTITKIVDIRNGSGAAQRLTVQKYTALTYFTLSSDMVSESLLNGPDVLAP